MKKAKAIVAKKPARSQIELRRWCIEQAIRWPTRMAGGAHYAGDGIYRRAEEDIDLLGRAEKLLAWVTK